MKNLVLALTAVTLSGLGSPAIGGDSDLELVFFRDVKNGSAYNDLPPKMPDPSRLSRMFEAEPRAIDWATGAEGKIDRAISLIAAGPVKFKRVACHTSTCEVMIVVAAGDAEANTAINREFGSVATTLGKELTMAIGGRNADETAVLAYFHDEGAGLR